MKYILLVLALTVIGCAGQNEAPAETGPVCETYASPSQVLFPDGVVRKSAVTECQSPGKTCFRAEWVNDPSVTFEQCEGPQAARVKPGHLKRAKYC